MSYFTVICLWDVYNIFLRSQTWPNLFLTGQSVCQASICFYIFYSIIWLLALVDCVSRAIFMAPSFVVRMQKSFSPTEICMDTTSCGKMATRPNFFWFSCSLTVCALMVLRRRIYRQKREADGRRRTPRQKLCWHNKAQINIDLMGCMAEVISRCVIWHSRYFRMSNVP